MHISKKRSAHGMRYAGQGNGDYLDELTQALRSITTYMRLFALLSSSRWPIWRALAMAQLLEEFQAELEEHGWLWCENRQGKWGWVRVANIERIDKS